MVVGLEIVTVDELLVLIDSLELGKLEIQFSDIVKDDCIF